MDGSNIVPSCTDLVFLAPSDFFHIFRGNVLLEVFLIAFTKEEIQLLPHESH